MPITIAMDNIDCSVIERLGGAFFMCLADSAGSQIMQRCRAYYFLMSFRNQAFTRWTPGKVNCLATTTGQLN
jgi:hypothetical protein